MLLPVFGAIPILQVSNRAYAGVLTYTIIFNTILVHRTQYIYEFVRYHKRRRIE